MIKTYLFDPEVKKISMRMYKRYAKIASGKPCKYHELEMLLKSITERITSPFWQNIIDKKGGKL